MVSVSIQRTDAAVPAKKPVPDSQVAAAEALGLIDGSDEISPETLAQDTREFFAPGPGEPPFLEPNDEYEDEADGSEAEAQALELKQAYARATAAEAERITNTAKKEAERIRQEREAAQENLHRLTQEHAAADSFGKLLATLQTRYNLTEGAVGNLKHFTLVEETAERLVLKGHNDRLVEVTDTGVTAEMTDGDINDIDIATIFDEAELVYANSSLAQGGVTINVDGADPATAAKYEYIAVKAAQHFGIKVTNTPVLDPAVKTQLDSQWAALLPRLLPEGPGLAPAAQVGVEMLAQQPTTTNAAIERARRAQNDGTADKPVTETPAPMPTTQDAVVKRRVREAGLEIA